jgi:SAM-dependent methyltransferase
VAAVPEDADRARTLATMRAYAERRQELDKLLERLAAPVLGDGSGTILDAGCGIGHLAPMLRSLAPGWRYHGVDRLGYLVEEARSLNAGDPLTTFEVAAVEELPERHPEGFDVVVSWKVLTWLEDFEPMLASLMRLTRRHLFVSSLFYDGDIDFHTRVTEGPRRSADGEPSHYNVYSLPRFRAAAEALGARDVHVHPFEIGIDLPRGDPDVMGTYTERLADGRRLQLSGALAMPWKVLRVDV